MCVWGVGVRVCAGCLQICSLEVCECVWGGGGVRVCGVCVGVCGMPADTFFRGVAVIFECGVCVCMRDSRTLEV